MYEYSTEMMSIIRENISNGNYNTLQISLESPKFSLDLHKNFLKKIVSQIQKLFSANKESYNKLFDKNIEQSNGKLPSI